MRYPIGYRHEYACILYSVGGPDPLFGVSRPSASQGKGDRKFALIEFSVAVVVILLDTGIFGSQRQREANIARVAADCVREHVEEKRRQLEDFNRASNDLQQDIEEYHS